MATLPTDRRAPAGTSAAHSRDTAHLKDVPQDRTVREQIRALAGRCADALDKSRPLTKHQIEAHAREILDSLELPPKFLGWTMVAVASAFWRDEIQRVPYARRLLLLPHCLKDAENCPADYTPLGLVCRDCGACQLTVLRAAAAAKGYRVLIAEGSPVVMQLILTGQADAVLGVGCLDSLEKALDKILLVGLPSMAVPLHSSGCKRSTTDEDWIREMIDTPHRPSQPVTETHVHLLRLVTGMFEPDEFARLLPARGLGVRGSGIGAREEGSGFGKQGSGFGVQGSGRREQGTGGREQGYEKVKMQIAKCRSQNAEERTTGARTAFIPSPESRAPSPAPLSAAETIARDFLTSGGKHFRPFITLATYDALTGANGGGGRGAEHVAQIPDAVRRVAMAMEVFHKASLVHDDIEDDDGFRYGRETTHRRHGTAAAINVGDYLIGLGYRLVAAEGRDLSAEVVADILAKLGEAHTRLCEGQGAELAWREADDKRLAPLDALSIYALKTSPAFEAALFAGMRMAGSVDAYREPAARFARHLGVAFQILNDLEDWQHRPLGKRSTGSDVLGARPTVLWALALERLSPSDRRALAACIAAAPADGQPALDEVRRLYQQADVFHRAEQLVTKHRRRARQVADSISPAPLRRLLHYFVDTIVPTTLDRPQ